MRRRILIVVVLVGCTLAVRAALKDSVSNDGGRKPDSAGRAAPAPTSKRAVESHAPVIRRVAANVETLDGELDPVQRNEVEFEPPVSVMELRGRYRELSEKRSLRMTPRELMHAIEGIEKTMAEQDRAAEVVLMQGVGRLHEAMTRYPGTEASGRALRALETLGFYVTRDGRLERHAVAPSAESIRDDEPAEADGTARDKPFSGCDRNAKPAEKDGTGEAARGTKPVVELREDGLVVPADEPNLPNPPLQRKLPSPDEESAI